MVTVGGVVSVAAGEVSAAAVDVLAGIHAGILAGAEFGKFIYLLPVA